MKLDEMKNKISMELKNSYTQLGFEVICKKLAELEKENAELKAQIPQWHDVRKEDDYPENKREGEEFYCKLKNEALDMEWYEVLVWYIEYQTEDIYRVPVDYMFKSLKTGKNVSDYVIAWCELPEFKE